jgi:Uma2 family endonuclease
VNKDRIKARIDRAIEQVQDVDKVLFDIDVHERTITHKLAQYLDQEFPSWDVDCEYDRDTADPKRLKEYGKDEDDAPKVYPDIIIHQRKGEQGQNNPEDDPDNLVVIEVKTSSNDNRDVKKIEVFRKELGYQHGLFIDFQANNNYKNEKQTWRPK